MNAYNYIYNPITNKYITISHQNGIKTLQHYINKLGGSDSETLDETIGEPLGETLGEPPGETIGEPLGETLAENVHLLENHIIRDTPVEFIFYNPDYRDIWDKNYINLVKNDNIIHREQQFFKWILELDESNHIQLIKRVIIPSITNPNKGKIDVTNKRFMMSLKFKQFLKYYNLPEDIEQNDSRVIDILKKSTPILKTISKPIKIWDITNSITTNNYVSIISIENKPVGMCISEIVTEKDLHAYLEEKYIPNSSFNLYIARVDIHPDHRGKGLCKPLVSYMIKQLKLLGYKFLFINNASATSNGIPACFCYYKAGINNNYTMQYKNYKDSTFTKMVEEDCKLIGNKLPRDYYFSM